jgi:MHS family proline/betaine transporter-like MFS transporter
VVDMTVLTPREKPRRWSLDDIVVTDPPIVRKAIAACAIGNITEWYDFGVYAYLTTTLSGVFFPGGGSVATLETFATFTVSFLIRPFGSLFFGPLADRIGRKAVLSTTMIMMALGTFLIGVLPSFASIGYWAPALLLVCRLLQGFSTGGEYGNAMTFIAEYAPDRRRGFLGSWLEFGTFTGYLGGATITLVISELVDPASLGHWAWRIPFYVALPLGLVGVYLRNRLADSPAFAALEKESEERERAERQAKKDAKVNAKQSKVSDEAKRLASLWPFVLVCTGLVIVWNVTNYMLTAYIPTYLSKDVRTLTPGHVHLSDTASQLLQIGVLAVGLLTIPFLGLLSDKVGRKPVAWVGVGMLVLLSYPMIMLIKAQTVVSTFFGLLLMGLALICFSATMPSTLPSLFPTEVRGAGLSVSFNVSISIFAGTTPTVMSALVSATHNADWPAYYLIAAGVVGAVALWFLAEPNGRRMWGSAPAAATDEEAEQVVEHQEDHEYHEYQPT